MTNWKEHGIPFEDFTKKIVQEWIDKGFSREQTKEWLNVGMEATDARFCVWLRNIKKKTPEWVLSYGNLEELRKEYNDIFSLSNDKVRNILMIGTTGSGKSALGNVISGIDEFEEKASSVAVTKKVQIVEFKSEDETYHVIDTVGIGDTQLSKEEILSSLEDAAYVIKDGLSQILFVTNGRFTKEQISAYSLLQETIFDENVGKYTTIVRTNFPNFSSRKECGKDQELLLTQNEELSKTIESCSGFIYVDNPPIPLIDEEDDERMRRKKESRILENKEDREESRKRLLSHLKKWEGTYRPEFLSKFYKAIREFSLIEKETKKGINDIDYYFKKNVEQLETFVTGREKIIELIRVRKAKVNEYMKNRFVGNTTAHATALAGKSLLVSGIWFPPALVPGTILTVGSWVGNATSETISIIKEKQLYDAFEESLNEDKKNRKELEELQAELKKGVEKFKETYLRFDNSEYKKQAINREKIQKIDETATWLFVNETKKIELEEKKLNHSTNWKIGRALIEASIRTVPTPICLYLVYRDNKEIEERTSLNDMEKVIKDWEEDLEKWKGKLHEDREAYESFKSKINTIPSDEKKIRFQTHQELLPKSS